jgi:hypothetical protein
MLLENVSSAIVLVVTLAFAAIACTSPSVSGPSGDTDPAVPPPGGTRTAPDPTGGHPPPPDRTSTQGTNKFSGRWSRDGQRVMVGAVRTELNFDRAGSFQLTRYDRRTRQGTERVDSTMRMSYKTWPKAPPTIVFGIDPRTMDYYKATVSGGTLEVVFVAMVQGLPVRDPLFKILGPGMTLQRLASDK